MFRFVVVVVFDKRPSFVFVFFVFFFVSFASAAGSIEKGTEKKKKEPRPRRFVCVFFNAVVHQSERVPLLFCFVFFGSKSFSLEIPSVRSSIRGQLTRRSRSIGNGVGCNGRKRSGPLFYFHSQWDRWNPNRFHRLPTRGPIGRRLKNESNTIKSDELTIVSIHLENANLD